MPFSTPNAPSMLQAVLEGTRQTFEMLFGAEPTMAPLETSSAHEAAVVVGFAGDVSGQLMLAMPRETAMEMAGCLLGEPVATFDPVGQSAMAEIANMTAGACATELNARGWCSNITVPTVITGERVRVAWPDLAVDQTDITLPFGHLTLAVGLKLDAASP